MPRLHELLSDQSTGLLKKYALEVAAELENKDAAYEGGKFSLVNIQNSQPELTEAIIRAVWYEMWQHAKPDSTVRAPYTHVVPGNALRVQEAVSRAFDGLIPRNSEYGIARQIRTALAFNRIAENQGRGLAPTWIRYWPPDEPLKYLVLNDYQQEHWRDQKRRVTEEAKAEKTLVIKFDHKIVKGPEATPEGMLEWANEYIREHQKLESRFEKLHARLKRMEEANAALEAELDTYRNRAVWSGAAQEILNLLQNPPEDDDGEDEDE